MTDRERDDARRWRRRAVLVGVALGLACRLLPPEYQVICEAVVQVCTGGL